MSIEKRRRRKKPQKSNSKSSPTLLNRVIQLDTEISLKFYSLFNPVLPRGLLKLLEVSGDGRLFFPVTISLLLHTYYYPTNNDSDGVKFILLTNLLIGGLLDLIFIGTIKHLVKRPRPVYNKNMFLSFAVDHWSFPSGHSSRVFYVASFCHFYFEEIVGLLGFEWIAMALGIWAVTTSFSRVLMGRHFVIDVLAGACLGVFEAFLCFRALNYRNVVHWIGD